MRRLTLFVFVVVAVCASGQQKSTVWVSTPQLLPVGAAQVTQWFDQANAVLYRQHALEAIRATMGGCVSSPGAGQPAQIATCNAGEAPNFPGPKDYFLIHVVRWKDPAGGSNVQAVDKQNWYVFNQGDGDWDDNAFAKNDRIFGRRNIYVLYFHFNRSDRSLYLARYTLASKKKLPAYLDHFVGLLNLFGVKPVGGGVAAAALNNAVWNATGMDTFYVPSDLTFTPEVIPLPNAGSQPSNSVSTSTEASQPAGAASGLPPVAQTVPGQGPPVQASGVSAPVDQAPSSIPAPLALASKTFDNEGRYHIDFSVAVPIRKISEFTYVSASNSLVPAKVDKQNIFAVFDYYFKAVDTKSGGWYAFPHLLTGVAIGSQPLKKVLIGGGYGPMFANFYVGLLLNTQRLPAGSSCGSTPTAAQLASSPLKNHTCPELSVGLNVGVGSIISALKK